jgi:hypothetical protein
MVKFIKKTNETLKNLNQRIFNKNNQQKEIEKFSETLLILKKCDQSNAAQKLVNSLDSSLKEKHKAKPKELEKFIKDAQFDIKVYITIELEKKLIKLNDKIHKIEKIIDKQKQHDHIFKHANPNIKIIDNTENKQSIKNIKDLENNKKLLESDIQNINNVKKISANKNYSANQLINDYKIIIDNENKESNKNLSTKLSDWSAQEHPANFKSKS